MSGYDNLFPDIANVNQEGKSSWFTFKRYRLRMALIMLCADLLGFGVAVIFLFTINLWARFFIFQWHDISYVVIVLFCLALYFPTKLYPGVGLNPAEEIRLVYINTTVGFLIGIFFFGFDPQHWHPNYLALFPFGVLSVCCVLSMRWLLRIFSIRYGLWGAPVVIIGIGRDANTLAHYFLSRHRLGFIPKYVITDVQGDYDITVPIPIFDKEHLLNCPEDYFSSQQIYTALIDISHVPAMLPPPIFLRLSQLFPRLIFTSNMAELQGGFFQIHDFEGITGVEVSKNVLSPLASFIKRSMDITFSLLLIVFTFPIWALTMLLIRFDSPGPIFYTQSRVGRNRRNSRGRERLTGHLHNINIYKFRSMVLNAEQKLQEYLNASLRAREEWDCTQKLHDDPRITRVGKWIRKLSIDELPQLINVLKGEMSLVGPRPLPFYHHQLLSSDAIFLRNSINPGITGLWQVSGRSNVGVAEMETLDSYYVHNWSPWLDVYIILRTVWVVLSRDGAY